MLELPFGEALLSLVRPRPGDPLPTAGPFVEEDVMPTRNRVLPSLRPLHIAAFGAALVLIFTSSAAFAAVTYVGQLRTVTTFATVDFVVGDDSFSSDQFQSQDVEQFEATALCHAGELGNEANSTGSQLSYLLPNLMLAEGNMNGQAEINSEADFAEGFGMSRIISEFSVDVPTQAHLQLSIHASGNGTTNFTLRISNGPLLVHRTLHDGEDEIDETFLLQPGNYEVQAQSSGYGQALNNGGGQPAFGSYSFSLAFTSATGAPEIAQGSLSPFAPIVAPNPVRGNTHISLASGTAR